MEEILDEDMIRIMANENDELWGLNPKVDDETVRVAREFLEGNPEIAKKYLKPGGRFTAGVRPTGLAHIGAIVISNFLGKNWYQRRAGRSIERLKLYDESLLRFYQNAE